MNLDIRQIAMDYFLGFGSAHELKLWAENELQIEVEPIPEVFEIFSLADDQLRDYAALIAQRKCNFNPVSPEAEVFAIESVRKIYQLLKARSIMPLQFCAAINQIDGVINDSPYQYGSWISELWNCCDYCDKYWTFDNQLHLQYDVPRILEGAQTAKSGG